MIIEFVTEKKIRQVESLLNNCINGNETKVWRQTQSVAISKLGFFEKVIFELRSKLLFRILTWNYEISHFKNEILWLSVLITRMYKTVWLEMMVLELGEVTPYCTS